MNKKYFLYMIFMVFWLTAYSHSTKDNIKTDTIEGYYYWISFYRKNMPPVRASVFATERIHIEELKSLTLKKAYRELYKNNYHCQDIVMGFREYFRRTSAQNPRDFDYGLVLQDSIALHCASQEFKIRNGYKCTIEECKIKGLFWLMSDTFQMSDEIPFSKLGISPESLTLIDLYYAKEP